MQNLKVRKNTQPGNESGQSIFVMMAKKTKTGKCLKHFHTEWKRKNKKIQITLTQNVFCGLKQSVFVFGNVSESNVLSTHRDKLPSNSSISHLSLHLTTPTPLTFLLLPPLSLSLYLSLHVMFSCSLREYSATAVTFEPVTNELLTRLSCCCQAVVRAVLTFFALRFNSEVR